MLGTPPLHDLMKAIRHPVRAGRALRSAWRTRIEWDACWARLREPRVLGAVEPNEETRRDVITALAERGVPVEPFRIDLAAYRCFFERARYGRFRFYYAGGRDAGIHEKALEHFLAAELMGLRADDVYIDIASYHSPAARIYRELYGCTSYVQDLQYPQGLRGDRIGGSAAAMAVTDGFASAMALHNAFEHFEGEHDTGFVREAARVLRPGGRLCIVPLFMFTRYAIQTDPVELPREGIAFDEHAVLYAARGWRNRHGRWYDAANLVSRLLAHAAPLRARVMNLVNARDVHPDCYAQFALLLEMPARE